MWLRRPDSEEVSEWLCGSAVARCVFHRTAADFDEFDTARGDLGAHFGPVDGIGAESLTQRVVMGKQPVKARIQRLLIRQIGDADGAAADLVLVGRTDPASGRADFLRPLCGLAGHVERLMVGQDQRAGLGNAQARVDIHPRRPEFVELLGQGFGGQHDAVADVAGDTVAQDTGRHQVPSRLLATDDQGMTCLLYTSTSPRDRTSTRMPSSA